MLPLRWVGAGAWVVTRIAWYGGAKRTTQCPVELALAEQCIATAFAAKRPAELRIEETRSKETPIPYPSALGSRERRAERRFSGGACRRKEIGGAELRRLVEAKRWRRRFAAVAIVTMTSDAASRERRKRT